MSNVPRPRLTYKEKMSFGIVHTILWFGALILTVYVMITEKTWLWAFLIYVDVLQIYIGIKSYKEGRAEKEKHDGKT